MSFEGFDELAGSPTYTVQPGFTNATRIGKIAWSSIDDFVDYMFPFAQSPQSFPDKDWLLARSLTITPFVRDKEKVEGQSGNDDYEDLNTYDSARVRIDYETSPNSAPQGEDPVLLLTHRWSIGGEFIQSSPGGFVWAADEGEVSEDAAPGIFVPTIEHQITWPRVKSPPFATIRNRVGSVNSDTMSFNTGAIAPETLMFLGAELQRDILSDGALAWQVQYRFSERRVEDAENGGVGGWNHFYRSEDEDDISLEGKTGFYRLEVAPGRDNEGDPVFAMKSFAGLFVQAP
jgi:hypothetical protein